MTETRETPATEALAVANTIRKQMGVFGLGVVGASRLGFTTENRGGLTFQARLHAANQTRIRIHRVTVVLTGADLYDIRITRPDHTEVVFADRVYCDELTRRMYDLDADGVPTA